MASKPAAEPQSVVQHHPTLVSGVRCWRSDSSLDHWVHFHESLAISRIWEAAETTHYRGENHLYRGDRTYVFEKGEVHRSETKEASSFAVLHFDDAYLQELGSHTHFHHVSGNPRHGANADRAVALIAEGAPLAEQESALADLVTSVLCDLAENPVSWPRTRVKREELRRAAELVEDQLDQPVSLDQAAAACGLSRFHFSRSFRVAYGVPFGRFCALRRVSRGAALLRAGQRVADAALAVGFADQSHFTRRFKLFNGITPGEYRRAYHPASRRGSARP